MANHSLAGPKPKTLISPHLVRKIRRAKQEYAKLMQRGKLEAAEAVLQELRDMGLNVRIRRRGVGTIEEDPAKVMTTQEYARDLCDQRTRAWNAGRFAEAERLLSEIRSQGYDVEHLCSGVVRFYKREG